MSFFCQKSDTVRAVVIYQVAQTYLAGIILLFSFKSLLHKRLEFFLIWTKEDNEQGKQDEKSKPAKQINFTKVRLPLTLTPLIRVLITSMTVWSLSGRCMKSS